MDSLLLTVGNIYVDHNIFNVNGGSDFRLESGKDYFAESGERVLGGSAVNVAMQVKRLGLDVGFIGKVGADEGAKEVKGLLDEKGIISDLISTSEEHSTSMTVNLIDQNGEFIGIHYGDASKTLRVENMNLDHELFKRCRAIYFGGTAKQPQLFQECNQIFGHLSQQGIKVFYDPNRFPAEEVMADQSLLQDQLVNVEGYFPNEDEILQSMDTTSIDGALNRALEKGVKFIALKLGAEGCRIKTQSEDIRVQGKKVEVVTTVGAGDCFNATFITSYLGGSSLKECAEEATAAAAIKVSRNIWPDLGAIKNF